MAEKFFNITIRIDGKRHVFEFKKAEEGTGGNTILAVKKLLFSVLGDENPTGVDSSDGALFDQKMKVALQKYQQKFQIPIKEYFSGVRGIPDSDLDEAMEQEFGVLGQATLMVMHGFWFSAGEVILTPTGYSNQNLTLSRSELYNACTSVVQQGLALEELTFSEPADVGPDIAMPPMDIERAVQEFAIEDPKLNPKPVVRGNKVHIAIRTNYKLDNNPPDLSDQNNRESFFAIGGPCDMLELVALKQVFRYFNKQMFFILRNDSPGEAIQIDVTGTQGDMVRAFPFLSTRSPGQDINMHVANPTNEFYLPLFERTVAGITPISRAALPRTKLGVLNDDTLLFIEFEGFFPPVQRHKNAVYGAKFAINKTKLDAIITPATRGREFNIAEAYEKSKQAYELGKDVFDKVDYVFSNPKEFVYGLGDEYLKTKRKYEARINDAIDDFKRKETRDQIGYATKKLDEKLDITGALREQTFRNRLRRSQEKTAALAATRPSADKTVEYDLIGLKNRVDVIFGKMNKYQKELENLSEKGLHGGFRPPINLSVEAERLKSLYETIVAYIEDRGFRNRGTLRVRFAPIAGTGGIAIIKMHYNSNELSDLKKIRQELGPEDNTAATEENTDLTNLTDEERTRRQKLQFAEVVSTATSPGGPLSRNPYTDATAVGYFSFINQIYDEVKGRGAFDNIEMFDQPDASSSMSFLEKCKNATQLGALIFVAKFRYPMSNFKSNLDPQAGTDFDIDSNVEEVIKDARQKIEEYRSDLTNKKKDDFIRLRKGKVFRIEDEFPLGEMCNLPDLYDELINKFNFSALMCDLVACIPDIPPIPTDFDINLPKLPKLPTFDPMAVIIPIIEAFLIDLVTQFLCSLINSILDILRDPSCEDLFRLALNGAVDIIDLIKEATRDRNLEGKMVIVEALRNSGIPPEVFASETGSPGQPNTVSSLFSDISEILTVSQLCALLEGNPSQQTLDGIEIVMSENHPGLVRYFYDASSIKSLFAELGKLVDPEICRRITAIAESSMAPSRCPEDTIDQLKKDLEQNGTAKAEVERAIEAVREQAINRSEAFKALFTGSPINKLVQNNPPPTPANIMPDFFKSSINTSMTAISEQVRVSLRVDSENFIEGLYDQVSTPLDQTDPEFNSFFAYKFYRAMAILDKIDKEDLLNPEPPEAQRAGINIEKSWMLREYLYSDSSIFELADPADQDNSNFLQFPFPTPFNEQPTKYRVVTSVDSDTGESVLSFKIRGDIDIANLNRGQDNAKEGRPFAPVLMTGLMVGKSGRDKRPQRIEVGKLYSEKDDSDNNRDHKIPDFDLPDSGIGDALPLIKVHANLVQEIQADINEKMGELQQDILNHLTVNLKRKFEGQLLPAIKSVFSPEEELKREAIAENQEEVPNAFREVVDFSDEQGEVKINFSLPDLGTGEVPNIISYEELAREGPPEEADRYRITISRDNFTNTEVIIDACDPAPSEEGLSLNREYGGTRGKKSRVFARVAQDSFKNAILETYPKDTSFIRVYDEELEEYNWVSESDAGAAVAQRYRSQEENLTTNVMTLDDNGVGLIDKIEDTRMTFYETLFEFILGQYRESKIFDNDYVRGLAARLLRIEHTDGNNCIVSAFDTFGVDDLPKKIAQRIEQEFNSSEYDPYTYDFTESGPVEKGMILGLSEFLIRIYVIEFTLRSSITMSSFSNVEALAEESYVNMFSVYIRQNITELVGEKYVSVVMDAIKKITNINDDTRAIKKIVNDQINDLKENINFIFGNEKIDLDVQNNFLNSLESAYVFNKYPPVGQTIPTSERLTKSVLDPNSQTGTKQLKLLVGANKPFFYLEKYFKYKGLYNNSLIDVFKQHLRAALASNIVGKAKTQVLEEEGLLTREQFDEFQGDREVDRIMRALTEDNDIKRAIHHLDKKVTDSNRKREIFSPQELQGFFDGLIIRKDRIANLLRRPLGISEEATTRPLYPIKHIMRRRIHIELNPMEGNSSGGGHSIKTARTFKERDSTIHHWINNLARYIDVPFSNRPFKRGFESAPKYYKIQTNLSDIFSQIGVDSTAGFFTKESIMSDDRVLEQFRKFYNIGHGVELDTLFDNDKVKKGLKLKKIKYSVPDESGRVVSNFYDQNDLNPETNPTVVELSEEEFARATVPVSDSQRDLGITENTYEVWTEYVFHIKTYPFAHYGETFDNEGVLPSVTVGEFMNLTGLTVQGPAPTSGGEHQSDSRTITRYGLYSRAPLVAGDSDQLTGTWTVDRDSDDIYGACLGEAMTHNTARAAGTTQLFAGGATSYSGPSVFYDISQEVFNTIKTVATEWRRQQRDATTKKMRVGGTTGRNVPPDANRIAARYKEARESRVNDMNHLGADNNLPPRMLGFILIGMVDGRIRSREDIKNEFSVAQDAGHISQEFYALLGGLPPTPLNTRNFFNVENINFENTPQVLRVAYPLSRATKATGYERDIRQRNKLMSPIKVLCRRIDYMHGTTIKDTQLFANYVVPSVLQALPTRGEASDLAIATQKKTRLLRQAFEHQCGVFRVLLAGGHIDSLEDMFKDKNPRTSNRANYAPCKFTIARLYGTAAFYEWTNNAKWDIAHSNFIVGRNHEKHYDKLFIEHPGYLLKSPIRRSTGALHTAGTFYFDTNISLQEQNNYFHPKYRVMRSSDLARESTVYRLNTDPRDVYRDYSSSRPSVEWGAVTENLFGFVMNYINYYVDRTTFDGIYGRTSNKDWINSIQVERVYGGPTNDENPSNINIAVTSLANAAASQDIAKAIKEEGVSAKHFKIRPTYKNISMVWADSNSGGALRNSDVPAVKRAYQSKRESIARHMLKFKVKDVNPFEEETYARMLDDTNNSYAWVLYDIKKFRAHIQIQNSIQYNQIFTLAAIDNILSPETEDGDINEIIRATFFKVIFGGLHLGVRLVGVMDENNSQRIFDHLGISGEGAGDGNSGFYKVVEEQKSFMLPFQDIENNTHFRSAIPFAFYEEKIPFDEDNPYACFNIRDVYQSYEENFNYLKNKLSEERNYKRIMQYSFPIQRIFDVCGVFSMFALSTKPEIIDIFGSSKGLILSNISVASMVSDITHNDPENTLVQALNACSPALQESMQEGHGSDGFKLPPRIKALGGFFANFDKMIARQAKEFLIKVPRTFAQATDPAYRDMKKKVDSCKLNGISFKEMQYFTDTKELDYGILEDESGNRTYAPINIAFPLDFFTSFVPFPPFIINYPRFKSSLTKMVNGVINSGVLPPEAQLASDLASGCGGLLGPANNAYGSFLTPTGLLVMGVNELPGDIGRYKTTCANESITPDNMLPGPCDEGVSSPESSASGESDPCDRTSDESVPNTEKDENSC
tara:strand:- start:14912 stop:24874 length:9963 start_codon:yes stop_codon:yes gene_type:complete